MDKLSPKFRKDEQRRRERAAKWWIKLRAAEPSARDVDAWLDWRGRDPRNAEAFERARDFAGRLEATDPQALAGLVAEFGRPTKRSRSRWWHWPTVRVAVSAMALATVAVVAYRQLSHVTSVNPAPLQFQTPVAVNRDLALPDGSRVVLGADSELTALFTAKARHVDLHDGEAYFKVKHEAQRPFYVRAGDITVRDIGTAFNVQKTGARVTVTVAQGRVRVSETGAGAPGDDTGANSVEIGAGQQVLYVPGAAGLRVARADPAGVLGWREQRLEFVSSPLSSVIANINRYAKRPLRIGDPAIGRLIFTGTVDVQHLDHWLAALPTVFPVRVDSRGANPVIVPASVSQHP